MEEELNYATVVFKNSSRHPKENNEDSTIYSRVKMKAPATAEPKTDAEPAADSQRFCPLAVALGILGGLLIVSISAIIYSEFNFNKLTLENQQLVMEKLLLENKTEELSRDRDDLNWTLNVILKFNTFPVNEYCPEKNCQPCRRDWILFQEKCYLFYNKHNPWLTWEESQKFCQDKGANLAVIDGLQEQEFIANHIMYYYDLHHGYWIGLRQTAEEDWFWLDGHNDTLGYWNKKLLNSIDQCALMIPEKKPTASWNSADCKMWNKFICESEILIRSN